MKWKFLFLFTLEFLVALGAIPSGLSMIIRPDGSGLGFTTDYLVNAPFSDFLIPGIVLFSVIGLCNGAGVFLSLLRKPQAGSAGILLGIFLMAWILLETYFIGYLSFLQPVLFGVGVIISGLGWLIARSKEGAMGRNKIPV